MAKFTMERIKSIVIAPVHTKRLESYYDLSKQDKQDLLKSAVKAANQRITRLERSHTGAETSQALRTRAVDYKSGKYAAQHLKHGKIDAYGNIRFSYDKDMDENEMRALFNDIQKFLNMSTSTTEGARKAYEISARYGFTKEVTQTDVFKRFEEIYEKVKEIPQYMPAKYQFQAALSSERVELFGEFQRVIGQGISTEADLIQAMTDFIDDFTRNNSRLMF